MDSFYDEQFPVHLNLPSLTTAFPANENPWFHMYLYCICLNIIIFKNVYLKNRSALY